MVMDKPFVAVAALASVTSTVKFHVPSLVGVPDISPVTGSKDSPAGSEPLRIAHV
jgi:hypothetical protein